jgi:hypothetical protein
MQKNFNPIMKVEHDGLFIHDGHTWAEDKYKLVGGYCDIFTKGSRNKWDQLVYIDLFSSPGYCQIKETGKILKSSPLIALSLPIPFDRYIFCDNDKQSIGALSERVSRNYADKNVVYINKDSNSAIGEIKSLIPAHSGIKQLCLVKSPSWIKMNALIYSINIDTEFSFSKSHNCRTKIFNNPKHCLSECLVIT